MPTIIDVWSDPNHVFLEHRWRDSPAKETRDFIRKVLGPYLPSLFVSSGLMPSATEDSVSVRHHDYSEDDVNCAHISIEVHFSENAPTMARRRIICNAVSTAFSEAFRTFSYEMPKNFMLTVSWGATNGRGSVNGVNMEW